MNLEETLARKRENLIKLIEKEDEAIRREMLKYEEAELCIRLQSECFNLYPVVIKALALLIDDDKRRAIFCSVVKGHELKRLAAYHNLTPKEAAMEFRSAVWELRNRINNGAFTEKESVNIRLIQERNKLRHTVRNYDALYKQLLLTNKNLREQFEMFRNDEMKSIENEKIERQKKELVMREKIRKELQDEMKRETEEQTTEKISPVGWIEKLKQTIGIMFLKCL